MDWLGEQLGFKEPHDWYRLTTKDCYEHGGSSFLVWFNSSPRLILRDYMPDYDWKEWLFSQAPKGFWKRKSNRRRYVLWLGEQLGHDKPEDWLRVKWDDFARHHGRSLLILFRYSIDDILQDAGIPIAKRVRG